MVTTGNMERRKDMLLLLVFVAITASVIVNLVYASNYYPSTTNGLVTVPNSCVYTFNTANLNFGSVPAGSSTPTSFAINVVNGGNIASNIIIYGGNWIGITTPAQTFYATNTLFTYPASGSYTGTSVPPNVLAEVDTKIVVPPSTYTTSGFNSIYLGLAVPAYTPAQSYNQILTLSSYC